MHLVRYQRPAERPQAGVRTGDTVAPVRGVTGMAGAAPAAAGRAPRTRSRRTRRPGPADRRTAVAAAGGAWRGVVRGGHVRAVPGRADGGEHRAVRVRPGVHRADRPELFLKSPAWRLVTDGEPIGIRVDSGHDVPEPELAIVANSHGEIVGFTICNDVSSRSIEGENPLYIPQAKVFAGGCALATGIRPAWEVDDPKDLTIDLAIRRGRRTRCSPVRRRPRS